MIRLISFAVAWGIVFAVFIAFALLGCWIADMIEKRNKPND